MALPVTVRNPSVAWSSLRHADLAPLEALVRAMLVVYLAAVAWLHVVTIPPVYEILRTACEPGTCYWGQVNPTTEQWLAGRGVSIDTYALVATLIPLLIPILGHLLAAITIWQRPTNWLPVSFVMGIAFCTVSASGALWVVFMEHPEWERPLLYIAVPFHAALPLMTLLFPDGRFVPRWSVLLLGLIALDAVVMIRPDILATAPGWFMTAYDAWWTYGEVLAIGIIAWRIHVTTDRRALRQTRIWFMSQIPFWLYTAFFVIFHDGSADPIILAGDRGAMIHLFLWAFSVLLFIGGVLMAVYLYNLYDLSMVIRRSLVYGLLSIALIGAYLLTVAIVSTVVNSDDSPVPALLATTVIALGFAPMRTMVQRAIKRLLYGDEDDPYGVLSRFGQQLQKPSAPERLLHSVVNLAQDVLRVPGVSLQVAGAPALGIQAGTIPADALVVPVRYKGEGIGHLTVAPRSPADSFSPADRRLIAEIALQIGIAAHTVLLSEDLRRSRERIVTAREEERRRIRRDLHDGLGPSLAALSLQIEIARDMVETDPQRSTALLDTVLVQARESIVDIRRLVYDLRPPALDDLGLVGAIRTHASRYQHDSLAVSIDIPDDLPPLSAAVEVAVYRIVQEALTNVVRHAHASAASVRIAATDHELEVDISDNGAGIGKGVSPGIGLRSMQERASELGGTCRIQPASRGGTLISASFPLEPGRLGGSDG